MWLILVKEIPLFAGRYANGWRPIAYAQTEEEANQFVLQYGEKEIEYKAKLHQFEGQYGTPPRWSDELYWYRLFRDEKLGPPPSKEPREFHVMEINNISLLQ
jgi:hypothetical protein